MTGNNKILVKVDKKTMTSTVSEMFNSQTMFSITSTEGFTPLAQFVEKGTDKKVTIILENGLIFDTGSNSVQLLEKNMVKEVTNLIAGDRVAFVFGMDSINVSRTNIPLFLDENHYKSLAIQSIVFTEEEITTYGLQYRNGTHEQYTSVILPSGLIAMIATIY